MWLVSQLRETVRNFCDKELPPPYADEIDRSNEFKNMRVSHCRVNNYAYFTKNEE